MSTLPKARRVALASVAAAVLLVVATPLAVYLAPSLAGADRSMIVLTGSMEPAIAPGEVVLVDAVDIDEVQVGDVVTFHPHVGVEKTYTHRVVDVTHDERGTVLTTKGDANAHPDPMQVNEAMLVGRVEHTLPHLGTAIAALQGPITPLALVGLSLVTIAHEVSRLLGRGETDEPAAHGSQAASATFRVAERAKRPRQVDRS